MARDRLDVIRAAQRSDDSTNIEMEPMNNGDHITDSVQNFYKDVEQILNSINTLRQNVDEVKRIHSHILSTPQTEESDKRRLENIMAEITQDATQVRTKLKLMQKETDEIGQQDPDSAEHRIRTTQHSMLFARFREVMNDYQLTQADYRDRCKARIVRQLEITGNVKSDDEIEYMIESGNPAIFNSEIVMETQQAKQSLAEIQARHNDILKLEKSIMELRDLFLEIATLVETQGELVNRIETHVAAAKEAVDKGGAEVTQAMAYRSKARIKKLICLAILVIILIIILGSAFGFGI